MKSLEQFEQAGNDLFVGFSRGSIGAVVEGRQAVYYNLREREGTSDFELEVSYTDGKSPEFTEPITLKDFLGGIAYAGWQRDPESVDPTHMTDEVSLLVQAIKLRLQQYQAEMSMNAAVQFLKFNDADWLVRQAVENEAAKRNSQQDLIGMYNEYVEKHKVKN